MQWIISLAVNAAALLAADWALDSIHISGVFSAIMAALVMGVVNTLIRPLLLLLTLHLTALTLGLFIFVVNAITFALTAFLVPGFNIYSFGGAFWGAIITSLVSWILSKIIFEER
ncbi:MAG: phage holin family protein [Bacillota bacterium]